MSSSPIGILVVESDEIVLALISHILQRQGYSVQMARTADQAAFCLSQSSYSVIVLDSKMTSVVEECPGRISRTILLSPDGASSLPVGAMIQKPVEFGLLVDTVRKMIE